MNPLQNRKSPDLTHYFSKRPNLTYIGSPGPLQELAYAVREGPIPRSPPPPVSPALIGDAAAPIAPTVPTPMLVAMTEVINPAASLPDSTVM